MIAISKDFELFPIQENDAWKLCDFVNTNENRLKRWFPKTLEQNFTPTLSELYVSQKINLWKNKEEFIFLLKQKDTHNLAGIAIIKFIDWSKKQAELAYCIGYRFEGKNLTSLSIKALTSFAFETLNLETLQIVTHESNLASIKVAEKAGFKYITILDNEFTPPGEPALDMMLYELKKA